MLPQAFLLQAWRKSHSALGGLCEAETCPGGVIPEEWLSQQHLGLLLLSQAFPLNTSVGGRGME